MDKKYTSVTTNRTPRPRSKRLREQGIGSPNSTVVLNAETGGSSTPSGDGHTHSNKSALDQITTDSNGYEYLTYLKEVKTTDPETGEEVTAYERVTEKVKAGYADLAYDLAEDSPAAKRFLSRIAEDTAAGHITFNQGLTALGDISIGDTGKGISEDGDAVLGDVGADKVTVSETVEGETIETIIEPHKVTTPEIETPIIGTENFNGALIGGSGWRIWLEESGASHMVVDQLEVRLKAYFAELEIRKVSHAGGNLIFSAAASRIDRVTPSSGGNFYRCYLVADDGTTSTMNDWQAGDQVLCQTFNIEEGTSYNVANRYYWRKVLGTGTTEIDGKKVNWIDLAANATGRYGETTYTNGAKNIAESGQPADYGDVPAVGDTIVLLGHQRQSGEADIEAAERQNAIAIEANSTTAPAIYKYQGIDDFSLDGKMVQADFYDSDSHAYKSVTYGDWFVGANTKISNNQRVPVSDPFSDTPETFVRYRQNVSGSPLLEIKAKIDAQSTVGNSPIASVANINAATDKVLAAAAADATNKANQAQANAVAAVNTDYSYLKTALGAISGSTQITGGLLLTNYIALKDSNGGITAGITGLTNQNNTNVNPDNIAAWFGGNPFAQTAIAPNIAFRFDGSGYLAGGNISWEDDGDTEVKGTIRADNFFHKVCIFQEAYGEDVPKHHIDGQSSYNTGTADVVFMVPLAGDPWHRSSTNDADTDATPDHNFYRTARTLHLPAPATCEGKTVDIYVAWKGDAQQTYPDGRGYEKNVIIRSDYSDPNDPHSYVIVAFHTEARTLEGETVTIPVADVYSTDNELQLTRGTGFVRLHAVKMAFDAGYKYAWMATFGNAGAGEIYIENAISKDGMAEAAVRELIENWFSYDNGDSTGELNEVARMSDLESLPAQSYSDRVVNLNADLLDGHHASDFVTSAKFGSSGAVLYPSNGLLTLPEFMATSERGNYVKIDGDIMRGNLQMSAGTAIKANDVNADLLAYKSSDGEGVTGAHWFVGTGHQGVVRSSGALERYNGLTAYTIWDESNFTPSNYLLSSAISDWAKAASKPAYNLDEVKDGTTRKLANYLPLTGGTVESLTVTNGLDADSITVGSLINSNTLAEYLDADAMRTWGDGRYLKLTGGIVSYVYISNGSGAAVGGIYNSGGVMTLGGESVAVSSDGSFTFNGAQVATQTWVQNLYLPLTGGTLKGALTFADSNGNSYGAIRAEKIGSDEYLYLFGNDGVLIDGLSVRKDNAIVPIEYVFLSLAGGTMEPGATITLQEIVDNIPVQTLVASQRWVNAQGFLTSADLSGYATTSALTSGLAGKQGLIHFLNTKDNNNEVGFSYLHLPLGSIGAGHASLDLSDYVTALGVSGDNLTWTAGGQTNNVIVPFATRTMGFRRLSITGSQIADANTMAVGGVEYALLSNYNSFSLWSNMPSGMSYGTVLWLVSATSLHGQLAWDSNHGVTTGVTRKLYWRSRNSSGWGTNDWHTIAFEDWVTSQLNALGDNLQSYVTTQLGGYLPLTAGTSKPLTGSLYVTPGASSHQTVEIRGSQYYIGLAIGSGNVNRGLYGQTVGGGDRWLLYFDASNTILNYGNVGIGTTSPSYKLDVNGNFHASGNAIVDGSVLMGNVSSGIEIKYDRIDWIDRSGNSPWTMGAMMFHYDGNVSTDDVTVRFELRPQVLTGTNTYTNVALESDVAFASKSNNQWTLTVHEVNASGNANISGSLTANGITCEDVLEVQSDIIIANPSDSIYFGSSGNAPRLYVYNGSLYYNNTMVANGSSNGSDIRMKDVIKYLEPSVRDVAFAPLIEFDWKEGYGERTASHSIGSIAQYWQSVFPQAVYEGKGGMLCLDYGVLGLASAITAARHSLDNERRIAELKLRVAELESLLESYEINNNSINN